jgi:beta-barrel assembly-enhancing protease
MKRFAALTALTCLLALPVEATGTSPAPSRERPAIDTLEGGLWDIMDKAEDAARASGERERSPELTAYVQEIMCKVADGYCGDIRLYLMNRPYFNASMGPNGYSEVWSGLLLRAEDEAQVAFVLGHEVTHYDERHSLEIYRALRNRSNAALVVALIGAAAGVGFVGDIAYLGAAASVMDFSRENESEADREGFDRAVKAGYDPKAGAAIWRNLIAEANASDFPRTRRAIARGSIFASHPVSAERASALDTMAAGMPAGETGKERYRQMIRPHLSVWLRDDIRRRDFGQTLFILDRLGKDGEDLGVVNFYRGEVYRLRRKDGDLALAKAAYQAATGEADAPAGAWRELGDILARDKDTEGARAAYTTYLSRWPEAEDRRLVERRLQSLTPPTPAPAGPPTS